VHYHKNTKASKTLIMLGKAITRNPPLLTGTVGATEPPVVVAGAPPVGNVVFQFAGEDGTAVVVASEDAEAETAMDVRVDVAVLETAAEELPEELHVPAEASLFSRVSLSPSVPSEPWI
jgi:NADPH-dependent curcumin reductase CurA